MNHAIDACARSYPPRVDTAFDIFNTAIIGGTSGTRRLCPNVYTFGALVSVCGRAGMVDKCTSLIQLMKVSRFFNCCYI
jgi:pentatricopeptide repeat protein